VPSGGGSVTLVHSKLIAERLARVEDTSYGTVRNVEIQVAQIMRLGGAGSCVLFSGCLLVLYLYYVGTVDKLAWVPR
jgi:hypothetical protein